jgi:hypothetical protein
MFDFRIDFEALVVDEMAPLFLVGNVWLQMGDSEFPEHGWGDNPLAVLDSFGAALANIQDSKHEAVFYFFDSPIFVRLTAGDSSADDPIVRMYGAYDEDSVEEEELAEGVEAEEIAQLSHLKEVYMRRLREVQEWAAVRGESQVISALAGMRIFE